MKRGTPWEIWRLDGIVVHLFNKHVMGDKTWTLQALADWVSQFEPIQGTPDASTKTRNTGVTTCPQERRGNASR